MVGLRRNDEVPTRRMTEAELAQVRELRERMGLGQLGQRRRDRLAQGD